jgi:ABC-type Fe3+-siderophore transport system permease subunit
VPRALRPILVGAALAGANTAYQTLFRNPLVSPDILGSRVEQDWHAVPASFCRPRGGIQASRSCSGSARSRWSTHRRRAAG